MDILAIIPALGRYDSIPRMNSRILIDRPLVSIIISGAKKSKFITDIYISTEDEEISHIAVMMSVKVIDRPDNLIDPSCTLDEVVIDAWDRIEKIENKKYDYIVTLQPNNPLITPESIDNAIKEVVSGSYDTAISVRDDTGLYWTEGKEELGIKDYEKRDFRKKIKKRFKETGGVLVSLRETLEKKKSRVGDKVKLVKLSSSEGLEIKNYFHWWIAEKLLQRKRIVFRVDGYREIGLGHIHRTMQLANHMMDHEILFVSDARYPLGIEKIKANNYPVLSFNSEQEFKKILNDFNPHIIINDILDTDKEFIQYLGKKDYFTVNFEDLGEGSEYANLVINALYESSYPPKNHYYGYKYVCLREEFLIYPDKDVNENVNEILITFGGTDLNNLTLQTLKAIDALGLRDININVILGLGYKEKETLYKYTKELKAKGINLDVKEDVRVMAREMYNADIVVTSNGRTVYEVACMGTPCISISQNEREMRHLFAHESRGILNLGMAHNLSEEVIGTAIKRLIENYELRKDMNKKLLKFDLKKGKDRVLKVIFENYFEWREKNG